MIARVAAARAVGLAMVLAWGAPSPARAVPLVGIPPVLSDARAAIAQLGSYTANVEIREFARGGHAFDRTVTIAFKKPDIVKMTIVDPGTPGSAFAWRGNGKGRLRRLGLLSRLPPATFDPHANALAFVRGEPVTFVLFASIVDAFDESAGTIAQSVGPVLAGEATDDVTETFALAAPAVPARIVATFDRATHLPVRFLRYEGDQLVVSAFFERVVANPPLRDADLNV